MGHSMGGHGALILALRNPARYKVLHSRTELQISCIAELTHIADLSLFLHLLPLLIRQNVRGASRLSQDILDRTRQHGETTMPLS